MKQHWLPVVSVCVLANVASTGSGQGTDDGALIAVAALGQNDPRDHRFRGVVVPSRQVELVAPLEEILHSVDVEEADRVQKNQVVATMDDRLQRVVVEAARVRAESTAEIDRARLDVEDATVTQELIKKAFDTGAATDLEVQRSRIQKGQSEAALTAALESHKLAGVNLRLEEARLARYQIRATFAATVVEILSVPGAMLNENENVVVVADLDTLEARLNLPVEFFRSLEVGVRYKLLADPPVNGEIEATLKTINPMIDTASQTFRCVFTIANPGAKMPAGFTVYLREPAS